jgi:hypothetical protein
VLVGLGRTTREPTIVPSTTVGGVGRHHKGSNPAHREQAEHAEHELGGARSTPRVLVVSHRRRPDSASRQPGYVSFTEAEAALVAVSAADTAYLTISPSAPSMRLRRAAGHGYRRLGGSNRLLPALPRDRAGATFDGGPVSGRYDLAVFVAMTVWDLPLLERLHDLRRRADRVAVWIPELWLSELADSRIGHEPFALADDLFVGVADSAPALSGVAGRPVTYLPMAVDAVRFAALNPGGPRPIDVLGIGRRLPRLHEALLDWTRKTGRHYVYDTLQGGQVNDYEAHRENLADTYRRSSLAITHYAKFDRPDEIGDQREIPGRLWEALASGVAMVGMPPDEALQRNRPGQAVVRELPTDPAAAVELIDDLCHQDLEAERRRNVHLALTANDWAHRWHSLFETVGLPAPVGLDTRLELLADLADTLNRPA